jgi:hypothetical protein
MNQDYSRKFQLFLFNFPKVNRFALLIKANLAQVTFTTLR